MLEDLGGIGLGVGDEIIAQREACLSTLDIVEVEEEEEQEVGQGEPTCGILSHKQSCLPMCCTHLCVMRNT